MFAAGNTYQFRMVAVYSNFDNKHGPNSIRVTLGASFRHRVPQNSPIIVRVWSTSPTTLSIEWQVGALFLPASTYMCLESGCNLERRG